MTDLESLTHEHFAHLEGTAFKVSAPVNVELILHMAKVLGHRLAEATRDPFSLLFRGPRGLRMPQGIYRLKNDTLGELEIFITQLADGAQGSEFEAVFT